VSNPDFYIEKSVNNQAVTECVRHFDIALRDAAYVDSETHWRIRMRLKIKARHIVKFFAILGLIGGWLVGRAEVERRLDRADERLFMVIPECPVIFPPGSTTRPGVRSNRPGWR
jgi:hypothetical protein